MFRKIFMPVYLFFFVFSLSFSLYSAEENSFRLATFNIRRPGDKTPHSWRERLPRCLEIIRQNKIDIYGIQEGYHYQVKDLTDKGKFQYIGHGRNDFKEKGEFSAILYKKDRFELLEGGTFGLSEKPHIPGYRSWKSAYPRIATWGIFRDKKSGKKFLFYNTHLDSVRELARINGLKVIMKHAGKTAPGMPVVLSGDFNDVPHSSAWNTANSFLKDSAMLSLKVRKGPGGTFHDYGKENSSSPIDFIFVSDAFTVLDHRTIDTKFPEGFASDHYPVAATLLLK